MTSMCHVGHQRRCRRFGIWLSLMAAGALLLPDLQAQVLDYRQHRRGMLHETMYNSGEIGRPYRYQAVTQINPAPPTFQWPGHSEVRVDGIPYSGQNNSFGGGMYLAASASDSGLRFSFCGGVGSSEPEPVLGVHSFPLSIERRENYPILGDGTLNPAFDPDEAEEIIVARWTTPLGLTVTRTTRAWSAPDYDDFIIHEYEVEHTGDRDGVPSTIEYAGDLTDLIVGFGWGLAPSQFGYERFYQRWYGPDLQARDLYSRFDRRRWMNYALDRTGKPESEHFAEWAATGSCGGGLLSPQAVGRVMLHFDTAHLSGPAETQLTMSSADSMIAWDGQGRLKQPFLNRLETSFLTSSKLTIDLDVRLPRKNSPYRNLAVFGPDWIGRGSFNVRQSWYFAVGSVMAFGPYTLSLHEKARFALAQVAGYGAAHREQTDAGLLDEGGSCGQQCGQPVDSAFFPVPNWWAPVTYGLDQSTFGNDYLSNYPLPSYVNSNTVTVREVADRAIQAFTGRPLTSHDSVQYWPDQAPDRGVYQIPIPVPAPGISVHSITTTRNDITWLPSPESFAPARLQAPLKRYEVYHATHPLGPWVMVDTVAVADPRYFDGGRYVVPDTACGSRLGWYYSVLSIDERGDASGRTNITYHELDALDPPPPPALDHPADLGRVTSPDVTFQWFRQPTGASWYWLEVSYDSTFADAIVDSTIIDTVRVVRLPRAGDVWWRVRAKHYSPWGSYSEVRRCTFAATGVRMDGEIPDEPFLGQNYPNPFNPQTTIMFGLRTAGRVRVSVLDLLGQEVAVLADEPREPGTYAVTWDASRCAGGTYFYRMTTGDIVVTKKLLLLR